MVVGLASPSTASSLSCLPSGNYALYFKFLTQLRLAKPDYIIDEFYVRLWKYDQTEGLNVLNPGDVLVSDAGIGRPSIAFPHQ
jgi:hypothetical protein